MSVVLMDSVTMSGKKLFLSKDRISITTNYSEAEKFSNMKKAMNFLGGSLSKSLRHYKFFAIPTESLNLANLADKDIELLKNVLGSSNYSKLKIPKVTRKNEHFTEFTKTLDGDNFAEKETSNIKVEINNNIEDIDIKPIEKYVCSVSSDYSMGVAQQYIEELNNYIDVFKGFFSKLNIEIEEKKILMSECDKKIASLNHLLEFYGEKMNACEHYKVAHEINQIVKKRRELKNGIAMAKKIKECFNMHPMIKDVGKEYESLKKQYYHAGYYQDWFEAKQNKKSIV